jgi:hypothetical protein
MNRRDALSSATLAIGGFVISSGSLLSSCKTREQKPLSGILNKDQLDMLEELAEAILPQTQSSPGAKDVKIGKYINSIVSDCFSETKQLAFIDGIKKLEELCTATFDKKLTKLDSTEKSKLLRKLEEESNTYNKNRRLSDPPHYYEILKGLAINGYNTSELVGTTVLRHVPIPGRYDGCLPYHPGEKAFTTF